jgi:hypothetical protein
MNKQRFIDYYVNLLIRQYHDKPKARDTIAWAVDKKAEIYSLSIQLKLVFVIDNAIGKQLDIVGKYVNMSRIFDNGNVYLDDNDYRFFIKWRIISNLNLSTIKSFHNAVNSVFNGGILVVNNQDMTISYWIRYPLSQNIAKLLKKNKDLLPAPAGVDVNYIVSNDTNKIFGFSDFRKNATDVITDNDIVGFSNVNSDNVVDFVIGDFVSVDEIYY